MMIRPFEDQLCVCWQALECPPKAFASVEELLLSGALLDIDCLLLDLCLPGMDGLTLQANIAQAGIPIVFLTARATEEEEQRAWRGHAAGFPAQTRGC